MKVVKHTPDLLILRPATEGLWLALAGALVLLVGSGVGIWLSTKTVLSCTRVEQDAATCVVARVLFGATLWERTVEDVRGARLDEKQDSDDGDLYRAMLLTGKGDVPLTLAWSSGRGPKEEVVTQVNVFFQGGRNRDLQVTMGESVAWIVLVVSNPVGIAIVLVGLHMLRTTWILDRSAGVLVRQVAGLRGLRVTEYDLGEVVDVRVARSSGDDGDTYRPVIWLSTGEAIPMTTFYSSGYRSKAQTVALVREFLGLGATPDETEWD
ncbi:MAG: hypothetical protein JXA09_16840 [Anaerolineae bacterium]|nr:hypothetical protein [Anaerolineae bacterium]